jgi:hypothetical protein
VSRLSRVLVLALGICLLGLGPPPAAAQGIARPQPSVLRLRAPGAPAADSLRHTGWTQGNGALAGGMIGVVAGMLGAFALRHDASGSYSMLLLKGATMFGALGVVLGSLAGYDAEHGTGENAGT